MNPLSKAIVLAGGLAACTPSEYAIAPFNPEAAAPAFVEEVGSRVAPDELGDISERTAAVLAEITRVNEKEAGEAPVDVSTWSRTDEGNQSYFLGPDRINVSGQGTHAMALIETRGSAIYTGAAKIRNGSGATVGETMFVQVYVDGATNVDGAALSIWTDTQINPDGSSTTWVVTNEETGGKWHTLGPSFDPSALVNAIGASIQFTTEATNGSEETTQWTCPTIQAPAALCQETSAEADPLS